MSSSRKLDARHKIQLGGIVIASGMRDALGLRGDLQRDRDQADAVAILAGALDYARALLDGPKGERARAEFLLRGRDLLAAGAAAGPDGSPQGGDGKESKARRSPE